MTISYSGECRNCKTIHKHEVDTKGADPAVLPAKYTERCSICRRVVRFKRQAEGGQA